MFGFLKDKLKSALSKFSKDVETEVEPVEEKALSQEPSQEQKPVLKEKPNEKETKATKKEHTAQEPTLEPAKKEHKTSKSSHSEHTSHSKKRADHHEEPEKKDALASDVHLASEPLTQEPVLEKKGFFSRLKDKLSSKKDQSVQTPTQESSMHEQTPSAKEEPALNVSSVAKSEGFHTEEESEEIVEQKQKVPVHSHKKTEHLSQRKVEKVDEKKHHDTHHKMHEAVQKEKHPSHTTVKPVQKPSTSVEVQEQEIEIAKPDSQEELAAPAVSSDEKPGFFGRMFGKKPEEKQRSTEIEKQGTGFFTKLTEVVTKKAISDEKFEELFWELEMVLLEQNVAVEVIELIRENLRKELVNTKVLRGKIDEVIAASLRHSIDEALSQEPLDLFSLMEQKKPLVIVFVGINGSGKTTTIAKFIRMLQNNHKSCVVAAADTFRAAAIQQLEEHTTKLGVKIIKHDYHADPAAVAFDAVKYAQAKHLDCVLIDTAGRLHSNINLMDEMKKIIRVAKPDVKIFVGEAVTGNDCIEQAKQFHAAVGIDGIILAKADIDEKGGAALSVSYVTQKPILYLGMGQEYDDLAQFDKEKIVDQMLG